MAGRLEPVRLGVTPRMNAPRAPPKRSNAPKKPNISPALCFGMRVANSPPPRRSRPPPAC
jgi:hypothetical protein